MKRIIAIVLMSAAVAAPAGLAQSPVDRIVAQERARARDPLVVGSVPRAALSPVQAIIAQERARSRDPRLFGDPVPTLVQVVEPRGFDWGDAGIGAAATVGLVLLASGAALVVRNGRVRSA